MKVYHRVAVLACIGIVALLLYVNAILKNGMVTGIDGPYYVLQVLAIDKYGHMLYPDPPLTFYAMYAIYKVIGNAFVSVALTTALFMLASAYAMLYLVHSITRSFIAGAVSAIIFLLLPHEIRLACDFMKNATGLLWIALLLLFIFKSKTAFSNIIDKLKSFALFLTLFMLCGLTHILDYAYMLLIAVMYSMICLMRMRRFVQYTCLELIAAAFTSFIVFYSFPQLQGGDIYKLTSFLSTRLEPSMSSNFNPLITMMYMINIVGLMTGAALAFLKRQEEKIRIAAVLCVLLLVLISIPLWGTQLCLRLWLMGGVPASIVFGLLSSILRERDERIVVMMVILGLVAAQGLTMFNAMMPSIPRNEYEELKDLIVSLRDLNSSTCIVVPNPKLRYWAQTIDLEVKSSVSECPSRSMVVIIAEKPGVPPKHVGRVAPRGLGKSIYEGKFVIAWIRVLRTDYRLLI